MMPSGALDKLAPEQRAKILAAAEKHAAAGPKTRTQKSCVTAEKLEQGARNGEMKVALGQMI